MIKRLALPLVLACGVVACGTAHANGLSVSRQEFGEEWPFTVSEGRLFCRAPSQALFESGGRIYPLNGLASARAEQEGYSRLETIWRPDPEIPGARVSIGDMIDLALEQCE